VWRFAGHYAPYVKYFPPEQKLIHLGATPFLLVTGQGNAGSGLSTKSEDWFDLNRLQFEPVFSMPVGGRIASHPKHFGREIHSSLISFRGGVTEYLRIRYTVHYFFDDIDNPEPIDLGTKTVEEVYSRVPRGDFEFDSTLSKVSKDEIETVFGASTRTCRMKTSCATTFGTPN